MKIQSGYLFRKSAFYRLSCRWSFNVQQK